jgi:glycosyltransferase involved in cell wall biosynthesis
MQISVIIPCYNVASYIPRCLKSISEQTLTPFEIICVNDGSTDNTLQVLQSLSAQYNLIIISQENAGACAARNKGLQASKGHIIQFLDADDEIMPEKLSRQVNLFKKETCFIASAYKKKFADGSSNSFFPSQQHIWFQLIKGNFGITSSNLWSRSHLMAVEGWKEGLKSSQEFDLMFRLMKKFGTQSVCIDENINTLINERITGSISSTDKEGNWERIIHLRNQAIQEIISELNPIEKEMIIQRLFINLRMYYRVNPVKAIRAYYEFRSCFPEFSLRPGNGINRLYVIMFYIFGFKIAEKLVNSGRK